MCGKFTQLASWEEVHAFSQPMADASPAAAVIVSTPMRFAKVIHRGADGTRMLTPMRWGFPEKSATSPARPKHMHARAETIDTRPTFAPAFESGRGLLMVHTFNEGEELPGGKTRQWTITPRDGQPIAIAVIFERWVRGEEDLLTFVLVTTPANALIGRITDRMPAVLRPQDWPAWLGETDAPPGAVKALLSTFDDGGTWEMREQDAKSRPPPAPTLL
ncbi:MAG: SOS response-associated peptidase family protein [Hyphomonadaceae bacterium]|nr:SOS response-associated peptidase family protein [Hyphomonadaceae bacterium]